MKKADYKLTKSDISPTNGKDLDESHALKYFFEKNQEEAAELLQENFSYYIDSLAYMGDRAFYYYLGSVKLYLEMNEKVFYPSDYVSIARELLLVFQGKKAFSSSFMLRSCDDFQWISSFITSHLYKIISDNESWVTDDMLISDEKIKNLIKRWNSLI